jgi:hypothetical protein
VETGLDRTTDRPILDNIRLFSAVAAIPPNRRLTMRIALIALCLAATALPAHAISRYNSMQLSCEAAQDRIQDEGAVILRYQSKRVKGLPLYDRYVAHGGFCQTNEYAKLEVVPTADTNRCRVLKCMPKEFPIDD